MLQLQVTTLCNGCAARSTNNGKKQQQTSCNGALKGTPTTEKMSTINGIPLPGDT